MTKQINLSQIFRFIVFLIFINTSLITSAQTNKADKTGILLVSFGSSYPGTKDTFDNIEEEVQAAFPELEIRWAYTSKFIRKKLRSRGEKIDSPAEALAKMGEAGFKRVAVQSLHVIPGSEYVNLKKTVEAFSKMPKGLDVVKLGAPLLYHHNDIVKLSDALFQHLPSGMSKNDALMYMGHGTHHSANIYYPGMQYYLWTKKSNVFLATVEGYPELDQVIEKLEKKIIRKVWLLPFMTIAGDHAQNDMAGEEKDSWKSILESKGYSVEVVMEGMAEHKEVVQIWIDHLKAVLSDIKSN
jgi:sirohydrochlorin cobaltochelatase